MYSLLYADIYYIQFINICTVYYCIFLGQEWSKCKPCKIVTLNHYTSILYKHLHSFCAKIVTGKLRANSKIKTKLTHFYVCLESFSDEEYKNKETESIFYYDCLI